MSSYMKSPCIHCPYRSDLTPFLTPERAQDLAYLAQNRYADFWCHKTTEEVEYSNDEYEASSIRVQTLQSKLCAGMLTLRAQCGEPIPKGFKPSYEVIYEDIQDMIEAYEQQWILDTQKD